MLVSRARDFDTSWRSRRQGLCAANSRWRVSDVGRLERADRSIPYIHIAFQSRCDELGGCLVPWKETTTRG